MRRIYCYPVDVHASRPVGTDFKQFEQDFNTLRYGPGESYGIPYRCLTPRGVSNLLVAGRCISADRRMQGSVRVMPPGRRPAWPRRWPRSITRRREASTSVPTRRDRLEAVGAFLPNA
jgi:hypothetical protein